MVERQRKVKFEDLYPKLGGQCRLCRNTLTGRQRSWCSKKCYFQAWEHAQIARGSSEHMRKALKRRDKEICAKCNRDCATVKKIFDRVGSSILKYEWKDRSLHPYYMVMRYFGFTPYKHTWEADHILELRDGGEHTLDNLQTLCIPCHKEKTKR